MNLSDDIKSQNLKTIEGIILDRKKDLRLLSPELIFSLVLAFSNAKLPSELLYLIEPHILVKRNEFAPGLLL
jgi:hypothetical protein